MAWYCRVYLSIGCDVSSRVIGRYGHGWLLVLRFYRFEDVLEPGHVLDEWPLLSIEEVGTKIWSFYTLNCCCPWNLTNWQRIVSNVRRFDSWRNQYILRYWNAFWQGCLKIQSGLVHISKLVWLMQLELESSEEGPDRKLNVKHYYGASAKEFAFPVKCRQWLIC